MKIPPEEQSDFVRCFRQTAKKDDNGVIVCLFSSPIVPYKVLTIYRKNLRDYKPDWAIRSTEGNTKPIIVYKDNCVLDKKEKDKTTKVIDNIKANYTFYQVFMWSLTHVGVKWQQAGTPDIRPHWVWSKAFALNELDNYKK